MAVVRPALSAVGCSQCRFLVLNLFTSGILRSTPVARPSLLPTRAHVVGTLPIRRFSSLPEPDNTGQSGHVSEENVEKDGMDKDQDEVAANEPNESRLANVPWYLQVEPPTHIFSLEPPPLPEIPADSPPLIGSLLEYASEEMGLDELSLLDLRKLDPPPALGPNLFMLFGTARSERHLNVSAGRLVRWLRAKHRVHADADGLLGPNERKTKLRRKARRAKLLGTMGTDDADDGIRTGWICVNLGTIDRSSAESAVFAEDGRASGFGVSHVGSTIIFQIMTEARRAEMGLETLWTQALEPSLPAPSKPGSAHVEGNFTPRVKPGSNLDPVEKAILSNLHRPSGFSGDRRRHPSGGSLSNQAHFYSTQPPLVPPATEIDPLSTPSPTELARILTYDAHQKQRLLDLLRDQLEEMDATAARAALSRDADGSEPTPFLELMSLAMETLPPTRTWEYRLAVEYKACISRLPITAMRSMNNVGSLVEEMRIYGIKATRHQYLQLLTCIFCIEGMHSEIVNLGLDVINTMHQRNEPILASDVIVSIIEGASISKDVDSNNINWGRELTARLEKLLFGPLTPHTEMEMEMEMNEELVMRLMTAYAHQNNWAGVWNAWGIPPRYLRPRSADMYVHVFRLAFASGSLTLCSQALRRCIPEAASEDPPVLANEHVRAAALKCIPIADPRAPEFADLPMDSQGQLGRLVRREFVQFMRLLRSNA
ncbi:hypothetical protein F5Y09DRAFT_293504 [Xylaria sp. FL1042]|nr:hypothetical protein F5Y09DRAFT_293224 [Xylaria sp. FL1042]KAI0435397.1 hypothetical protein F5Y09DRAFT_293504 [Xylaria sp. FL1042]